MGASVVLLMIGFWPQGHRSRLLSFSAETGSSGQPGSAPLLSTSSTLLLEWPALIRMDDSGVIRLSFDPTHGAALPAGEGSGDPVFASLEGSPQAKAPSGPVLVEARLDMSGLEVDPTGMASMPLTIDQGVAFSWKVRPLLPGDYQGIVWLSLRSVPLLEGSGSERALAALPLDIRVFSLPGFGTMPIRILGVAGMLASLILATTCRKRVDGDLLKHPPESQIWHDENNMK
jgi:hypothetical protein